jgi:choline-sulfatase
VGYDTWYGGKVHLPVQLNAERIGFTTFSKDERGVLAQEAADLITRSAGGRPWATVVSFINPHDICFHALRAFANTDLDRHLVNVCRTEIATLDEALIVPEGAELPPLPANWEPQENEPEAVTELINRRGFRAQARANWDADAWRRHLWAYARLTELVDRQIGQVLAALDASGQADDTLVVFTSDHGDLAGAHRLEHKSFFYEEAARVPLVLRLPGRIRAATLDDHHLANTGLDLLPTLCDYAGAPIPAHCLGRSLRAIAETGHGDPGTAFGENILGHMLCEGRFKYVRYERGAHAEQLYDLDADPGEMRNHRDRHPAVVARLSAALDQQIAAHAAVALGPLSSFPGHE